MDSGTHGFFALGGVGAAAAVYGLTRINYREILDVSKPGGYWKIMALLLALANLKSLPFAWHYRLIKGLLTHVTLGSRCPKSPGPSALFQPLIVSSRTSLWETDYNGHKSNSTYFSDLDIARMHLITCLFKRGLHRAHYEKPTDENEARYGKSVGGGQLMVMLGGVSCHFKREIKPYAGYEIWTRVLTWDRKWLYLVSHIVKKGAVAPTGYSQQPWKKVRRTKPTSARKEDERFQKLQAATSAAAAAAEINPAAKPTTGSGMTPPVHPAIFATSIAKYVFKSGRITIPPELALTHSELLPERSHDVAESDDDDGAHAAAAAAANVQSVASLDNYETFSLAMNGESGHDTQSWTWHRVEAERLRGLQIAQHFAELDQLNDEFTAEEGQALGRW